jgi:hypothetical protein
MATYNGNKNSTLNIIKHYNFEDQIKNIRRKGYTQTLLEIIYLVSFFCVYFEESLYVIVLIEAVPCLTEYSLIFFRCVENYTFT